jgi:hypothetical protein
MWLKKNEPGAKSEDEVVAAIVMPHLGHSDDDVQAFLKSHSAEVHPLAAGFLSVKATRRALKAVEAMARVELKVLKQMH